MSNKLTYIGIRITIIYVQVRIESTHSAVLVIGPPSKTRCAHKIISSTITRQVFCIYSRFNMCFDTIKVHGPPYFPIAWAEQEMLFSYVLDTKYANFQQKIASSRRYFGPFGHNIFTYSVKGIRKTYLLRNRWGINTSPVHSMFI